MTIFLYQILFGILVILAELRITKLLYWFAFLRRRIGLGAFYIFIGFFSVGDEWYVILMMIVFLVVGSTYLILALCCGGSLLGDDKAIAEEGKKQEAKFSSV